MFKHSYNGYIGIHGLENLWESMSKNEQKIFKEVYTAAEFEPRKLLHGEIISNVSTGDFLLILAGWAIGLKYFDFAEKLLLFAESVTADPVTMHFIFNHLIEIFYRKRDEDPYALKLAIDYCEKDITLFPVYSKVFLSENASIPRCLAFQQLAIIYEKQGRLLDAIQVCNIALQNNLHDTTKGGFNGRLLRLQKKLYEQDRPNK